MSALLSTIDHTPHDLRASVVIPTYNRRGVLVRVLRALATQTVSPATFEVLVVADGCTDGTVAMCQVLVGELPYRLRVLEQANSGPAAARNRGVEEAGAPLIVFVDDDVVPDASLLATHLAAHAPDASDMTVAIGPLLPPHDIRLNAWGAWEERTLCQQYAAMEQGRYAPTYRQFYTGNASIARRHILDVGGFDPRFHRAEDVELGLRLRAAGCAFHFLPEARGWHYVSRTFASWARMPVAYGWSRVAMGRTGALGEVLMAREEYRGRQAVVKLATRACVGSRKRVAAVTHLLHAVIAVAWKLHLTKLAYACCSTLYNLRYFDSLAAELGGPHRFWHLLSTPDSATDDTARRVALALIAQSSPPDAQRMHEGIQTEMAAPR